MGRVTNMLGITYPIFCGAMGGVSRPRLVSAVSEADGHVGEATTFTLTRQAALAVSIPVISAGGIADGNGIVAAFALGAEGVQLGTRFVASKEAPFMKTINRQS